MTDARPIESHFSTLAFRTVPLAVLAFAALASTWWGPAWSRQVAPLPWIVSLVIVGLPHGAADFALSRRAWHGRWLAMLWLGYAVIMAAVAGGFWLAPVPMVVAFVALSVWHFGLSHAEAEQPGRHQKGETVLAAFARGSAVLAPPLVFWPAETSRVAGEMATLVHANDPTSGNLFDPAHVQGFGAGLAVVACLAFMMEGAASWSQPAYRRRWCGGLIDAAVIGAVGFFIDPLLSVGLYFLIWHAWRQMEPLADSVIGKHPTDWRGLTAALTRIHIAALPLLLPTWTALAAAWWAWSPEHSPRDLAVLSIAAYLVVTPAHELLGNLLRAHGLSEKGWTEKRDGAVNRVSVTGGWARSVPVTAPTTLPHSCQDSPISTMS